MRHVWASPDSTRHGGSDWYNQSSTPQRWVNIVKMLEDYDLNVLPYYEYCGSIGQSELAKGSNTTARPLTDTNDNSAPVSGSTHFRSP